jgi:hypothetical protein
MALHGRLVLSLIRLHQRVHSCSCKNFTSLHLHAYL